MRIGRVAALAAVALTAMLALAGCGGAKEVDPAALASQVASEVAFDEQLTQLDANAVERVFRVDPSLVETAVMYVGSGATVDEVSVWEAKDDAAAQQIEATLQSRVDSEKEDYASYKPEEVPKLDNAVLERSGKYVALCVTSDADNARSIIQEAMGS